MPTHPERRKAPRLPLEIMLRLVLPETGEAGYAETQNLSEQGMFFRTRSKLEPGQHVRAVLVFPEELESVTEPGFIGCKGTVLRVSPVVPGEVQGVAMEIQSFDFPGSAISLNDIGII